MIFINNTELNPYFNLALEEYILKNFEDDCFIIWRNKPAIIVGKNQNTLAEINVDYVKENNIPVVRRLSGGGAVFHDLGNLNYTFIMNDKENSFNNFRKFTQPIIDVLEKLSVKAEFSGRNDLTIDGRKFSGTAQCSYKNRMLHHGAILFSANITDLSSSLKVKASKFEGKSVKSVVSRVTNISEHLKSPLTIEEFIGLVTNHITENQKDMTVYALTADDLAAVNKLTAEKYSTWDWNFGYSPEYGFTKEMRFEGGSVEMHFSVEKGSINKIKIFGDFFGKKDIAEIEKLLVGVKHREEDIREALNQVDISQYFTNITIDDLLKLFF